MKKLHGEKKSLMQTNQELQNQIEIARSEHQTLLDEHSHQLKNSAEQLERLNKTKKNLKKFEDAYIQLRTKHHYIERDLHEHKEQNSQLKSSVQSLSKVHKSTIEQLEEVKLSHGKEKQKLNHKIETMGGILKSQQNEKEQAVTEKEALESSIRRDSIMHKKILDDLRLSTNNNMGGSRNKRSTYRPLSYDDMRTTEESEKFSLSTSAISKALEDVDHGLLTFVSEEEAAEEELRRIHGLLGVDPNVNSPFRTY